MKNILLVGAPRSGKTTLTRMLKGKYQIVSGDATRVAYHKSILNDDSISSGDVGRSIEFRSFLIELFSRYLKYNNDLNFIFDTVDIDLNNCDILNKYDVTVIVLGYTLISPEELVKVQKENDKKDNDWSYSLSDEKRYDIAVENIRISKVYKDQCDKLGFKFVDTSFNRNEVLSELCNWIDTN